MGHALGPAALELGVVDAQVEQPPGDVEPDAVTVTHDPSVASSLKFLRKTPWAREKVESLYLFMLRERRRKERAAPAGG